MPKLSDRILVLALALALSSCAVTDTEHLVRVSVPDQKMLVFQKGVEIARYDVSTSKFGVGDRPGSFATPLGAMQIARKIGDGQPSGMKFHGRRPTGEIVHVNAPGRDPIVSRILWLRGLEPQNALAFSRAIYIHGTAEEWKIGTPASYGCIRMRSRDVIALYDSVGVGARVEVSMNPFPKPVTDERGESEIATKPSPSGVPPIAPATMSPSVRAPATSTPPPHQG